MLRTSAIMTILNPAEAAPAPPHSRVREARPAAFFGDAYGPPTSSEYELKNLAWALDLNGFVGPGAGLNTTNPDQP